MTSASGRPPVFCHMMAPIDGRIVNRGLPLSAEEVAREHGGGAPREDFMARGIDLAVALERIGVRVLMLEGGGRIDGGMLRADDDLWLRYRVERTAK